MVPLMRWVVLLVMVHTIRVVAQPSTELTKFSISTNADQTFYLGLAPAMPGVAFVKISGGQPPFRIRWSTGDTLAHIQFSPHHSHAMQVHVSDAAGNRDSATFWVEVIHVSDGGNQLYLSKEGASVTVHRDELDIYLKKGYKLGHAVSPYSVSNADKRTKQANHSCKTYLELLILAKQKQLQVSWQSVSPGYQKLLIRDAYGIVVSTILLQEAIASNTEYIDLTNLHQGNYVLELSGDKQMVQKDFSWYLPD